MEKGTYSWTKECDNCGQKFEVEIPKGVRAGDYFGKGNVVCPNCGCTD